ncbi:glycyl-tRNA synthetase subunit beta [alpha proteobacterium AAP81b]|nr:glycyl-tRNA synthetase subunit beta [alpha proteobacterium AAP81b]
MTSFLLELASEEIPARMQAAAAAQLRTRFIDGCKAAGLAHGEVIADATPRRLWLIAQDVATGSAGSEEEVKGPRADAPPAAIDGFLKKTGLAREALEARDTPKGAVLFAVLRREGRPAAAILAELVPAIVGKFEWPKSMRWGAASASTASPRWVRPLTGIVALLGEAVVACEALGVASGRRTRGHRVHAPAPIEIASAATYADQLRAAYVLVSSAERRAIIEARAAKIATAAGLAVIPDAGLVAENAGLTEWPVPLLGSFDPAFLTVPREVIQLTMRTNQKYFALADAGGALAPGFICVANLEASDGGASIVKGNERVLSARLSDARFFWDQDVATVRAGGLEAFLPKLGSIVFHEKLGTVADKVERVAKLARWLVESGALDNLLPLEGGDDSREARREGVVAPGQSLPAGDHPHPGRAQGGASLASPLQGEEARAALADLAEQAARLCKADLVSATVGEFPEVQGIAGAYLARVAGLDAQVADAIRDHYKPVGQGDDVPTAPVSVAVALADKLDVIVGFFSEGLKPTGSGDPFALRRAALGVLLLIQRAGLRVSLAQLLLAAGYEHYNRLGAADGERLAATIYFGLANAFGAEPDPAVYSQALSVRTADFEDLNRQSVERTHLAVSEAGRFLVDRLKVQQRDAGVRHDLIDAVFALGEDDIVRLLAQVAALQAFVITDDGASLLAGYKRAANILRIETAKDGEAALPSPDPSREREGRSGAELALGDALDAALPAAEAAIAAEDFTAAMTALASLRAPVDAFFADVMVNDPDPDIRAGRLSLLARFRDACHRVADFSRIEG